MESIHVWLSQTGRSSKKDAGYFSCCQMPFLLPFQSLCITPFCSMHTFLRAFCEDLSCLEAEGIESTHAFPVTNSILFWFGPPHWRGVNLRSWSGSWTSRKDKNCQKAEVRTQDLHCKSLVHVKPQLKWGEPVLWINRAQHTLTMWASHRQSSSTLISPSVERLK